MNDKDLQIHRPTLKRFVSLDEKGHLAHAYLLAGPAQIGKSETALGLAKFFNCEKKEKAGQELFCNACPGCLKINSGSHPDLHVLENDSAQTMKIEQIRELLKEIGLRPFMAEKKIFILKNIENLTPEAGNAFLKTLEEPTPTSLLLLTTANLKKVMGTIRSRCQIIHFYPASKEKLVSQLVKNYTLEAAEANFLAYFACGSWGKAKQLYENRILDRKNEIIDRFIFSRTADETYLKKVVAEKETAREFLDILLTWIHDALLIKTGVIEQSLCHTDRFHELKEFQQQFTFKELLGLNKEIVKTHQLLTENLNVKIPLLMIIELLSAKQQGKAP